MEEVRLTHNLISPSHFPHPPYTEVILFSHTCLFEGGEWWEVRSVQKKLPLPHFPHWNKIQVRKKIMKWYLCLTNKECLCVHCSKCVYAGVSVYLRSVTWDVEKVCCQSSTPLPHPSPLHLKHWREKNTHIEGISFSVTHTHPQAILFSDADYAKIRKCGKCIVLYGAIT